MKIHNYFSVITIAGLFSALVYLHQSSVTASSSTMLTHDNVCMHVELLDEQEQKVLLSQRCIDALQQHAIVPIRVNIANNGTKKYIVNPNRIGINALSFNDVYAVLRKKIAKTAALSGLAVGGLVGVIFGSAMTLGLPFMGIVAVSGFIDFFGLTAVVTSISIALAINAPIKNMLKKNMLHKKVVIKPGDSYEGLVFAHEQDWSHKTNVAVHVNGDQQVLFTVHAHQV